MDKPELPHDSMAVVVLGEFDPLLITPRWLREKNLIGSEDYESYEIEVISKGVSSVSYGSLQLKVLPTTLQVTTDAPNDAEAARDLAVGILRSGGTRSVGALGINRIVHFRAHQGRNHAIGDALAPKEMWSEVLHLPGLQNLNVRGVRNDGYGGSVNVQVQPSNLIESGVYISINDHNNLTLAESPADRDTSPDLEQVDPQQSEEKVSVAREILTNGFSASRRRAQSIIDRVASMAV
ncbi:hypothetical protein [Streptomyces sp. bgisy060]|uniref:hypothetical protein n=1 Tax=Streptomyces sp. bgisy060 TaxID=3413775 RepID=UPI003EB88790